MSVAHYDGPDMPTAKPTDPRRDHEARDEGEAEEAPEEDRRPRKQWASYLRRYRPGLQDYVLEGLTRQYGEQTWEARLDPTSELILTILTQNTADTNAEKAYEALRRAYPSDREPEVHKPGIGWGGDGLRTAAPPDWTAVENAPLPELIDVIRPGGLGPQKAPRLQATLRHIREQRGDYIARVPRRDAGARGPRLADPDRRHRQEDRVDRARVLLRDAR